MAIRIDYILVMQDVVGTNQFLPHLSLVSFLITEFTNVPGAVYFRNILCIPTRTLSCVLVRIPVHSVHRFPVAIIRPRPGRKNVEQDSATKHRSLLQDKHAGMTCRVGSILYETGYIICTICTSPLSLSPRSTSCCGCRANHGVPHAHPVAHHSARP